MTGVKSDKTETIISILEEEVSPKSDKSRASTPEMMASTPPTQHHDSISNENDEVVAPQPRSINPTDMSSTIKNSATPSAVGASWGNGSTASPHRRSSLPWAIESTKPSAPNPVSSFALTNNASAVAAVNAAAAGAGSSNSSPVMTRRASVSPDAGTGATATTAAATASSSSAVTGNGTAASQPYVPPHLMMSNHASEFMGLAGRRSSLTQNEDKEFSRSLRSNSSSSIGSSSSPSRKGGLSSSASNTSNAPFSGMDSDSTRGGAGDSLRSEEEDSFEHYVPPKLRTRSKSINSFDPIFNKLRDFASSAEEHPSQGNSANNSQQDLSSIWGRFQLGSSSSFHNLQGMGSNHASPASMNLNNHGGNGNNLMDIPLSAASRASMPHRRSSTFSYPTPWGTSTVPFSRNPRAGSNGSVGSASSFTSMASLAAAINNHQENNMYGNMEDGNHSLPGTTGFHSLDAFTRSRKTHRFPHPNDALLSEQYDSVSNLPSAGSNNNNNNNNNTSSRRFLNPTSSGLESFTPRRHSVAGPMNYALQSRYLADALHGMSLDEMTSFNNAAAAMNEMNPAHPFYNRMFSGMDDYYDASNVLQQSNVSSAAAAAAAMMGGTTAMSRHSISGPTSTATSPSFNEVGRGIPLHALPSNTPLYIVEFKAGRSDIFYVVEGSGVTIHKGDLVIVEADRGKDLGKVINHSITPHQIHMLQAQQPDALSELHRVNKEIHPKRIYRLAQPPEITMLVTKSQDEAKAMAVCQTKVRQKKLSMEVVDAEYQWDRRKLTFYFVADRRIDFRELVRDLFKIYKTRIWMCAVNSIHKAPQSMMYMDPANEDASVSSNASSVTSSSASTPSSHRVHSSSVNGMTSANTTILEPTSTPVA